MCPLLAGRGPTAEFKCLNSELVCPNSSNCRFSMSALLFRSVQF